MARRKRAAGRPCTVKESRYFEEIKACLGSGWTSTAVITYLRRLGAPEDEIPQERALQRWRKKHMPTALVLPPAVVLDRLKGLDYKVDVLKELSSLVPLLQDRVAAGLQAEKQMMGGLPSAATDKAAETLVLFLRELRQVQQDLGLLPLKPNPAVAVLNQGNMLVLKDADDLRDLLELEDLERKQVVQGEVNALDAPRQIVTRSGAAGGEAGHG